MRNRFVIDNDVGCLIDNLDELSTIHFSDRVNFFELYEFLNRQERRIDNLKTYSSDPFASINDQLHSSLHTTAQDFLRDYQVIFTEFTVDMTRNIDHYCTMDGNMWAVPARQTGNIVLKGSFLGRSNLYDKN